MKKIFLSCLVLLFTVGLFAQQDVKATNSAQVATDQLVAKYKLDKKQAAQMLKIQSRKVRNEGEIVNLENTDLPKYLKKVEAIEKGTNFSIRRMLVGDQLDLFKKELRDLRYKRATVSNQMHKEGKTPLEIKQARLKITE